MWLHVNAKQLVQHSALFQPYNMPTYVLLMLIVLQQQQQHNVLAGSIAKGLARTRSAKIASIHGLQAAAETLLPKAMDNAITTTTTTPTSYTTELNAEQAEEPSEVHKAAHLAGKYEIHTVSGEPNYKSVNLTWEVEFVAAPAEETLNAATATNSSSLAVEPPKVFQIFFCEMQSFGPQRCRSKLIPAAEHRIDFDVDDPDKLQANTRQVRHYEAQIDNLRMATKYSFHIRPQTKRRNMKITARAELFDNELNNEINGASAAGGQTIIIPTKGFSAQATRCLPHASEIEVETGPYFGGKIVVDGGNCGIKGNPNDPVDKYTFQIDHKMCGSMVKPETNTVETFITVQENLGIFTYSTRRFVVVCSYQSGMQTVRASFTVPGKGGVAAAYDEPENDPFIPDERIGREQRYTRFVNKSELVLKDTNEDFPNYDDDAERAAPDDATTELHEAFVKEVPDPALSLVQEPNDLDVNNSISQLKQITPNINEEEIKHEYDIAKHKVLQMPVANARLAKYAKLIIDQPIENKKKWYKVMSVDEEGRAFTSSLHFVTANMGSVILTVSLSVILVGICLFLIYRESHRRSRLFNANAKDLKAAQQPQQHQHKQKHLKNKTLPRALLQTCQGTM